MIEPMEYLATFHDEETNMTALVFESQRGGFAVALRDDDSGNIVPSITHGFKTMEDAIAKAKAAL